MTLSFTKKIILSLLFLVVSFSPIIARNAQAVVPVVDGPVGISAAGILVAANVTAGVTTTATTWATIKENGLNFLVYQASQVLMNQITNNIVNWIRGGFNGSPSFAIDPEKFFNDLADVVAGDLANQIRGLAICDFDADFRINLMNSLFLTDQNEETFSRKVSCPFDIIDTTKCDSQGQNCRRISPAEQAQNFAQDFVNGGWSAYEATLQDSGNKFGVALATQKELKRRTAKQQSLQQQKLNQSGGFLDVLNMESCNYPANVDISTKSGAEKQTYDRMYCTTATPGSLVSDQLQKVTSLDLDRLGFADNLNKIASAFIQQVTKMAIEGVYTPRTDGGNGLSASRRLGDETNYYQNCQDLSETVVSTPQQDAEIAALVNAAPSVQAARTELQTAETSADLAFEAAQTAAGVYETARLAFERTRDVVIPQMARDLTIAQTNLANCQYNVNVTCINAGSLAAAVQRATLNLNEEKDKIASRGAISLITGAQLPLGGPLYIAQENARVAMAAKQADLVIAEREKDRLNENLDVLVHGTDGNSGASYANARLSVLGIDMVRAGSSCVDQNVNSIVGDIGDQTNEAASVDELFRQAQEAEPKAI